MTSRHSIHAIADILFRLKDDPLLFEAPPLDLPFDVFRLTNTEIHFNLTEILKAALTNDH
jgi:hypothetical protein